MDRIYHITDEVAWRRALGELEYRGDSLSREGFIHASTREQVAEVANRLFAGRTDLLLLTIGADRVAARIVRENLEGGSEQYPHIYGPLNLDAVLAASVYRAIDGRFQPPAVDGGTST